MMLDVDWIFLPLCLLAGMLYAGVLYFTAPNKFSSSQRWLMATMRCITVTAIAMLLLAPVAKQTLHEHQPPLIALVEDHTLSVRVSADSTFTTLPIQERLKGRFRMEVEADTLNTHLTDLGRMLTVPPDAAAVVLATDGIYNRGSSPVATAERLGIPVYTIALGDTTLQRDAAIADLRSNRFAMLGSRIPVELTLNATLLGGRQAQLTVSDDRGQTLYSRPIDYTDDNFSVQESFSLEADAPGMHRYTASLSVDDGERVASNNSATFYVDVIDTRYKIAIIANAPHPDIAALKRTIESSPNYEATVLMADDIERHTKAFTPQDYQMAILHNLPSHRHPSTSYASELPSLYVIGLQTDIARFNALHTGLEIASQVSRSDEVTALYREGFSLFSLSPTDAETIGELPPLAATFGEARMSAGLQTLFAARLGTLDTRQPLVSAIAQGKRRSAFVWGEGLWRWRLAEYALHGNHEATDRLLTQLIAFISAQQKQGRLRVEAQRTYTADEPPLLRAQLYNETYEPTNSSEVALHLSGDSTNADYTFLRDGGSYRLQLPDLPEGIYRYRASTPDGLSDEGVFAIENSNLELQRLTADHALLRAVSAASGGRTFYPSQTDSLVAELSRIKPTIHTHTRYAELLSLPAALALILLLLGAEWVLRKYHGGL